MLFHVYVDQKMYDHFKRKALKERKSLSTIIREDLYVVMECDLDALEDELFLLTERNGNAK